MSSDALFQLVPGEWDRLVKHLKHHKTGGWSMEKIKKVSRKYKRRMLRHSCPEPKTLVRRLYAVYDLFAGMKDPKTNMNVLTNGAHAIMVKEMGYVQKGLLSDLPGESMYREVRRLASGFVIHRCTRSTSALEGFHAHYRASQHHGARRQRRNISRLGCAIYATLGSARSRGKLCGPSLYQGPRRRRLQARRRLRRGRCSSF